MHKTTDQGVHARRSAAGRRVRHGVVALVGITSLSTLAVSIAPASAAPLNVTASKAARVVDPLAAVSTEALTDLRTYIRSGDTASLARYETTRDSIASVVAGRLGIDTTALQSAWSVADVPHQMALMAAFTQLGVPYRRNQSKPGEGFDCSGLTSYAWGVAGTKLTRQSSAQIRNAGPRTHEAAQAGDIMYYPGHAMMYLGVDFAIVHAPYSGRTVEVDVVSRRRGVRFGNPLG